MVSSPGASELLLGGNLREETFSSPIDELLVMGS
jgi:hypothetical protein